MNRHFYHPVKEFPIDAEIECRRLFPLPHSEEHAATFAMKIETAAEVDDQRPAGRRSREGPGRPYKTPERHNRNIHTGHLSNRGRVRTSGIDDRSRCKMIPFRAHACNASALDVNSNNLLVCGDRGAETQRILSISFRHACRVRHTIFGAVRRGHDIVDGEFRIRQHTPDAG